MNAPDIRVIEDATDDAIADWLEQRLAAALARTTGPVPFTMPGGSTPFPILERLVARDLDWARLPVWPNDDRMVAPDHPASNTGRIRALVEPAGGEVMTLSVMEQVPRFALSWLGMGADGHLASLFPNTDPRVDDPLKIRQLTPEPLPPEAPFDRITLTMPALLDSDEVVFVMRGADKAVVFDAAANGDGDLPIARFLAAADGAITCFR